MRCCCASMARRWRPSCPRPSPARRRSIRNSSGKCAEEKSSASCSSRRSTGHAPEPTEATAVMLALHAYPMYFYRRGKGRYQAAPGEHLRAALAGQEKKRRRQEQVDAWAAALGRARCRRFSPRSSMGSCSGRTRCPSNGAPSTRPPRGPGSRRTSSWRSSARLRARRISSCAASPSRPSLKARVCPTFRR